MKEEIAIKPVIRLFWNSKDVYKELSPYLSKVTYTDHEEAMCDEVRLVLTNTSGIWFNDWYPKEGDTLELNIGYQDKQFSTGLFEIDNITLYGPPDSIEIKAIATGIKKALRTRNNKAFEKQTLKQIALYFANKHGFTLVDSSNIMNQIAIDRRTQENKNDLAFLSELAREYGFLFSIKGQQLVFISYHDLDNAESVTSLDNLSISSYSLNEKTYDTYAAATVKTFNRKTGKLVTSSFADGIESSNTDEIRGEAVRSGSQAYTRARSNLWNKNRFKQSGNISLPGNTLLVAGINFDLEGFGLASGKYHITKSTHDISDRGYITTIEIRKTGTIPAPLTVPKQKPVTPAKAPDAVTGEYKKDTEDYSKPLPGPEFIGEWF
ncbi:MAG: hypothetical protein LBQ74_00050 [Prevotella sp.]|jgi:phage protein D|nr:hypothetical protein [Prevotella sp.]